MRSNVKEKISRSRTNGTTPGAACAIICVWKCKGSGGQLSSFHFRRFCNKRRFSSVRAVRQLGFQKSWCLHFKPGWIKIQRCAFLPNFIFNCRLDGN
uniref:Uncharacterized protein n=1 Tax=Anguilla anguilla TaxID=7936 RepID=A0A0E9WJ86_ANGAN